MRLTPEQRGLIGRAIVAAAITVVFGTVSWLVVQLRPVERIDLRTSAAMHRWAIESDSVERLARWVTHLGDPLILAVVVLLTAASLAHRRRADLVRWLLTVAIVGALTETMLKLVIGRTRPDLDSVFVLARGNSFPSGHAMNTAIVLGAAVWAMLATKRLDPGPAAAISAVAAVTVIAVGLTRPILGVHFLSDVVAGWILAAIWLRAMKPARLVAPRRAPDRMDARQDR